MPGDDKHFSVAVEAQAGNCLENLLKKTSTAQRDDGAEKGPVVTDTDKTDEPNVANKYGDR